MLDPNFRRAVIFLCDHQNEGSMGFILNKPLKIKVDELIGDFPEFDSRVYFGGPVATDTIHYLHQLGDLIEDSMPVGSNVYWGGNYEKLKFLIASGVVKPGTVKFFAGYSGWSSGQLDEEMQIGSWISANMDPNYLFAVRSKELWAKVLEIKGGHFSVLASIPEHISWN
ncbi:MAG: YqgE/AlgH family protein [Saprospirales bacterium]|nr:MAG: YqgE/AlgH family protein [Saprospirales bacterium]